MLKSNIIHFVFQISWQTLYKNINLNFYICLQIHKKTAAESKSNQPNFPRACFPYWTFF